MSTKADLDTLRAMVGNKSTSDDGILGTCLEAAGAWVYDRVYSTSVRKPEVVEAVILLAARLYKRRNSPEGVAGWDEQGVVRILARDPDIERLLEQHVQVAKVYGIG